MDGVLERAAKRREELMHRRKKLMEQLHQVEKELKELEGFFSVASRFGAKEDSMENAARQLSSLASGLPTFVDASTVVGIGGIGGIINRAQSLPHGSKTKVIVNLARDIISTHGPLPARRILELIDRFAQGETLIPGRDEKGRTSYLSAVLSKDGRFESDREAGGYKLVEPEGPPRDPRLAELRAQENYYRRKVGPGAENTGDTDDLLK